MLQSSSIRPHEDFSITGWLLEITHQWHKDSSLGSCGARIVNATCTPFTALIDTVFHLALGTFTICGGSLIGGSLWNLGIHLAGRNRWSVLRFEGGLINLTNALHHAIGMVAIPIIGFVSPDIAANKFKGNKNSAIEELQVQNGQINKLILKNNLKNTLNEQHLSKRKVLKNHQAKKNKQIQDLVDSKINQAQVIITLKADITFRDTEILNRAAKIDAQDVIISKLMAVVEQKNRQIEEKSNKILELQENMELEEPDFTIEHEEELNELAKKHEREIKAKDLHINELNDQNSARGKKIDELNRLIAKVPKEVRTQYYIDNYVDTPKEADEIEKGRTTMSYLPLIGSFF